MACIVKVDFTKNPALEGLFDYCGDNCTQFYTYLTTVVENINGEVLVFRKEFVDEYNRTHKIPLSIDAKNKNITKAIRIAIVKYFNKKFPTVESTAMEALGFDKVKTFGYSSITAREEAKRHFANRMLVFYHMNENLGVQKVSSNLRKVYTDLCTAFFNGELAKRLSKLTGINKKEILDNLIDPRKPTYINDILVGFEEDIDLQLQDYIALYREYNSSDIYDLLGETKPEGESAYSPREEFMDEVLQDSRLKAIRLDKKLEQHEEDETTTEEEVAKDTNGSTTDDKTNDASTDNLIRTLDDKMGLTRDFLSNLDNGVRALLATLPKQIYSDINDGFEFDTDNHFGLTDFLDANTCASVLLHHVEFSSPDQMMKDINNIAKTMPGLGGFKFLHNTLTQDINLQLKVFREFRRAIIEKHETWVESSSSKTITSNSVNRTKLLATQFLTSFRSSALLVDPNIRMKELVVIKELINTYKINKTNNLDYDSSHSELRDLANNIAKQLQTYFPTIDELTIRNYVLMTEGLNSTIDEVRNLEVLVGFLDDCISAAEGTRNSYMKKQEDIATAFRYNAKTRRLYEEGDDAAAEKRGTANLDVLFAKDYVSDKALQLTKQLAKALSDYTNINMPINSRNIYGNMASDAIKNNMLTSIIETLNSRLNKYVEVVDKNGNRHRQWDENSPILRLAEHRFQSKQYDFSSILLEHKIGDNIINYGLFRREEVNGKVKYVPTNYATSLLQIRLYQGAHNANSGDNVSYDDMSKGDYIGSAWRNFFNTTNSIPSVAKAADYFMRIPSDAKNNFVITAPRYSVEGLLNLDNKKEIRDNITKFLNSIEDLNDLNGVAFGRLPIVVSPQGKKLNTASFMQHIQSTEDDTVNIEIPATRVNTLEKTLASKDKSKPVRIAFRFLLNDNDSRSDNVYVMEGTYRNGVLHDAHFVGIYDFDNSNDLKTRIRHELELIANRTHPDKGGAKWSVARNHPMFEHFRQIFKQELTDMVTASSVLFKRAKLKGTTDRYIIKVDGKGLPILNKGKLIKSNTDHNGLHPVYHFDKNDKGKRELYTIEDGHVKLTGKVFTSDRLVLFDYFAKDGADPVRNFGNEILDDAFDFVAERGSEPEYMLQFDKDGNVIITEQQQEIIDRKLEEFIISYIHNSRVRLEQQSGVLAQTTELSTDNIADFILNTHLAYVAFNDVFEGDTKFYKDAQTFLKRAKEVQGAGSAYGLIDITKPLQPGHQEISNSPLSREFGGRFKMFTTFKGITVYNTIHTDEPMLQTLEGVLQDKEAMGDAVMTKEAAHTLLYGRDGKGGYQSTIVNDAQSYITFEEWVRRITMKGQLPKYKDLIERILDESKPLSLEDITAFIQVQKNFYYDQYYNPDTKTVSPRQIKNAEFVLVPRLIKGTELEKVYQVMQKLGIDQLNTAETSKAGKSHVFTLWDADGNLNDDVIADLEKEPTEYKSELMQLGTQAAEDYNYAYLYEQSETQQHINDKNKAGVQIMKKILDNIDKNSPQELQDAKAEFMALYSDNIAGSFDTLMTRLGVERDKNGDIILNEDGSIKGLNYAKLFDMLKDELARLGLNSNLVDYCTQDLRTMNPAQTVMPNYMSLVSTKLENIVQSIFNNNITRQTLPGFHAVQVTGMGFRKFSEQVDRSRTSNDLRYHPQLYKHKETGEEISERIYDKLSNEEKANYTKSRVASYCEILLPAENFGFDRSKYPNLSRAEQDALFLKQLQAEHLDEIIGYRIPTEGKQSMAMLKVVGFTDGALGSTIVVPDAWVTQTGADFDIDTIYGIQYSTYFDKDNVIHRIKYKTAEELCTEQAYFNYISKQLGGKIYNISDEEFEDFKKLSKEEIKRDIIAAKNALQEAEQEAYQTLPEEAKRLIKEVHTEIRNKYGVKLNKEQYEEQLRAESDKLASMNNDSNVKDYLAVLEEIIDDINTPTFYSEYVSLRLKTKLDKAKELRKQAYLAFAHAEGLLTQEEYYEDARQHPGKYNSKAARDGRLLDLIKFMLNHPASLEENLSRSNFDDVKAALKKYNSHTALERSARTPYNILDQAEYQEDAMSGRKLKGFSVTRDTFCSICNTVRPLLANNSNIVIAYSKEDHTLEELHKRFSVYDKDGKLITSNVEDAGDKYIVTHTRFGWSNDNKNVDGQILTAYSSQTTAHILDAMKTGNVPNVNELTFQVYKTLVDVGSNYDTAVSFIMLPGVTRIVEAYNNANSIYTETKGRNFIREAIKVITDELGIEYDAKQPLDDILEFINAKYGDVIQSIFGKGFTLSVLDSDNANQILDAKIQGDRLNQTGIFSETSPLKDNAKGITPRTIQLLYDLQTVIQYNKINNLADNIKEVARVLNPDKFGAKQTLFATRAVFDNAVKLVADTEYDDGSNFRLQVHGNHILEAIYPGISNYNTGDEFLQHVLSSEEFITNSEYAPLAAFMKYATAASIKITQTLFITQSPEFLSLLNDGAVGLRSALSYGYNLTEDTAKLFTSYIVNYVVGNSRFLRNPLSYIVTPDRTKREVRGFNYEDKPSERKLVTKEALLNINVDRSTLVNETFDEEGETSRVFGFGHSSDLTLHGTYYNPIDEERQPFTTIFTVKDINNPTQEEIDRFCALSPAQKVYFIKTHFRGDNVFKHIDVSLYNRFDTKYVRKGMQSMTFNETSADIETVYMQFKQAFRNTNPLIACAAADVIKYAFIVEGYRMGNGTVSKMIPNTLLTTDDLVYGTGIIADSNNDMAHLSTTLDAETREEQIERFVRSHSDSIGIAYRNVYRNKNRAYELIKRTGGIIWLNGAEKDSAELAEKYGIVSRTANNLITNKYVRLRFSNDITLYRIVEKTINDTVNYFLIPLNPLETNENSKFSSNALNNKYPSPTYYERLIDTYIETVAEVTEGTTKFQAAIYKNAIDNLKDLKEEELAHTIPNGAYTQIPAPKKLNPDLINTITDWYKNSLSKGEPILYVWNVPISKMLPSFKSEMLVNVDIDGSPTTLRIKLFNNRTARGVNLIKYYTGSHIDDKIKPTEKPYTRAIQALRTRASHNKHNKVPQYFSEIISIEPAPKADNIEGLMLSEISDVAIGSVRGIYRRSHDVSDQIASKVAYTFRDAGISPTKTSVTANMDTVITRTADYIEKKVDDLIQTIKHYPAVPGAKAMDDIDVIKAVKKDPTKRREYLKTLLEPQTIIADFGMIRDLNIDSQEPSVRAALHKINEAIGRLENLPEIANATRLFAEDVYNNETNNPLVRDGLISVLDGFYKTNAFNAMFHDIQETSNPLVQIVLKNFRTDYNAKLWTARKRADQFAKDIEALRKEAASKGERFDLDQIIDEYGRFKLPHNNKFLEDRDALKKKVDNATPGTLEHLKAKLDYDEWEVKHINQAVADEYYEKKNALLRKQLYPTAGMPAEVVAESGLDKYPEFFAKYEALRLRRIQLRNQYDTRGSNPELDAELDSIDRQIQDMQYPDENSDESLLIFADKLNNYIKGIRELNRVYFKLDPKYDFEEQVKANLDIINKFKNSSIPESAYVNNPEYVRANRWLKRNTTEEAIWENATEIREKLAEAYKLFQSDDQRTKFNNIRKNPAYRNQYGEFDPRLIPDEVIETLKADQALRYGTTNERAFSDKTLIGYGNHNTPHAEEIYNDAFYEGFLDEGATKEKKKEWRDTVTAINELLAPYYNPSTGELRLVEIIATDTEHADEHLNRLKALDKLYSKLRKIRGEKKTKETKKWIKDNVEFDVNQEAYDKDKRTLDSLPKGNLRTALNRILTSVRSGKAVPNSYLYGFVRPKDAVLEKYIDTQRTEALKTIKQYRERRLRTEYWDAQLKARTELSAEEYEKWFNRNNIYNPYTRRFEPISIWWQTRDKADRYAIYPKFPAQQRVVRDGHLTIKEATEELGEHPEFDSARELSEHYFPEKDFRNKNFNPLGGHSGNYKVGSNPEYDNKVTANAYELRAQQLIKDQLLSAAKTPEAKRYIEQGWLPARAKQRPSDTRGWLKEVAKVVGWENETYDPNDWYDDIDYSKDKPLQMPMLQHLRGKGYKDVKFPKRQENETDEEFNKRMKEYEDQKAANEEIHKHLLDRDWVNVVQDFIVRAGTYNAIQDNKYELFYVQNLLKRYGAYSLAWNINGQQRIKKDMARSDEEAEYLRRTDTQLLNQFNNTIRRIVYDQWKTPNNPVLMKWLSTLQSFTSAQYMMLNFKGGIANVTLGESQIFGEAVAGEFIGKAQWAKSKAYYTRGLSDYIAHVASEYASTLQGAIIKFMDIVDYDEHSGVSRLTRNAQEILRRIRNFGYSPQTAGEHAMQNSMMFALMESHRLVLDEKYAAETGKPKYRFMNFNEFKRRNYETALLSILNDKQKQLYEKYKKDVTDDHNITKEYAWLKKDTVLEFITHRGIVTREQQRQFVKVRKELDAKLKKEFEDDVKHPTILSQFERTSEGKLGFKKDSMLAEIDIPNENGEPSDAFKLLAEFKGRVVSVNKYIHGVYDKLGRAQLEKFAPGSLIMQYHKHIPTGIMKRYRMKGMYSEERGTLVKGMYRSLWDFLSIPFKKHKDILDLNDKQIEVAEGIQNIFKEGLNLIFHWKLAYNLMPDYDKANLRRLAGDLSGVLAALFVTLALKAGFDDDDESLLYNLGIYEADRLATEAAQYFPIIAYGEAKKQWQSPMAAGSFITDLLGSMSMLAQMIMMGDEFDGEYKSGKFAGESKLKVYVERRIPIWRGIKSTFIDIQKDNKFYKRQQNFLGFFNVN